MDSAVQSEGTFAGKTAVVTGAAGTLGVEVVRHLAYSGARVLAVDFDDQALRRVASNLREQGLEVTPHFADVREPLEVAGYAEAAGALGGGGIDLFFNNAGIEGTVAHIEDLDIADFRRVFDVNVIGVALGMKYVLPLMSSGGAIVNTASTAALQGSAGMSSYIASKHAVLGLTRTAAIDAAARGVRVNAICPGPIKGPMMESLDSQRETVLGLMSGPNAGRTYSSPAHVAGIILFLLSDAAALINGQAIVAESHL